MKLVIDIPEEEYKRVKDGKWYGNGLADYIENGTPLPKGHGRLIDINNINKITLENSWHYLCYEKGNGVVVYIDAPTIIEADTTRDCKTCGHSNDGKCAGTEECHDCMWESKYIEADAEERDSAYVNGHTNGFNLAILCVLETIDKRIEHNKPVTTLLQARAVSELNQVKHIIRHLGEDKIE